MRWILVIIGVAVVAILAVVLLTGGESESDKAMAQVCDARDSISEQVDTLKGLQLSDVGSGKATDSLQAIQADLGKIAEARSQLASANREEIDQANQKFADSMRQTLTDITTSSAADTRDKATGALRTLAATYRDTYGKIDCS